MRIGVLILAMASAVGLLAGEISIIMPDGQAVRAQRAEGKPLSATLKDGTRLIGVDMSWYAPVAEAAAKPGELDDGDRKAIQGICTVPSFYDRCEILLLQGDADRAVGLMQLVRDRDFHAGKGEVIWRAELWYFEFQNGGWAKVSQQNKVLDRQRFASREKYLEYVRPIRFVPKLGGIKASDKDTRIELSADDLKQFVRPGEK
jgi:hypothetical protein